jgi:hypothetical protein
MNASDQWILIVHDRLYGVSYREEGVDIVTPACKTPMVPTYALQGGSYREGCVYSSDDFPTYIDTHGIRKTELTGVPVWATTEQGREASSASRRWPLCSGCATRSGRTRTRALISWSVVHPAYTHF